MTIFLNIKKEQSLVQSQLSYSPFMFNSQKSICILKLSSFVVEIPNDAYTTVS